MHKKISPLVLILIIITVLPVSFVAAQVNYDKNTYTSYQVVNLGTSPADITVTYYDESGNPATYQPTFNDVPANGSVTVQQSLESSLPSGRYSAVISADQPIAAIANQQLGDDGSGTSVAPFSSYSGASQGATSVMLPVIMHNWYGYNTTIFVQNVGSGPADVTISYSPTTLSGCTTGATGVTDIVTDLAQYAAASVSQETKTALGAPSGWCVDRFLGSATITSTQPIVVVVNEEVQNKLFTYNGFTDSDADTTLLAPAYMNKFYGYYTSLTIANPGATDANVTVHYTSDSQFSLPANTVVTATHTVPAGESITIYDGPGTTSSDIDSQFTRFFGSVKITSDQPIVAVVNQESSADVGNQAGSYNAFSATAGTSKIAVPLIQSDFYGYYTSLTIQTVDGNEATLNITYTSDGTYSSVPNQSKTYVHTTVNGFLNIYEGPTASASQSDILDDPDWEAGGNGRFIGTAIIEVTSGSNIVAFVNSESSTAPNADTRDSLYTYNAFNTP